MLIVRCRDEMKRHLTARLDILQGQKKALEDERGTTIQVTGLAQRMEGIKEAVEMIEAWEQGDIAAAAESSMYDPTGPQGHE